MPKKTRYLYLTLLIFVIIALFFFKRPYDGEILEYAEQSISMYENTEIKAFAFQELSKTLFETGYKEKSHFYAKKASENLYNTGIDFSNASLARNLCCIFYKLKDYKNSDYYAEKLINLDSADNDLMYLKNISSVSAFINQKNLIDKVNSIISEYEDKLEDFDEKVKVDIISELYKINFNLKNINKADDLKKLFVSELLNINEPLVISAKYALIADFFLEKENFEEFLKVIIVIPSDEIRLTKLIEGSLHFYKNNKQEECLKLAKLIDIENIMKIRKSGLVTNLLINYSEVAYKLQLTDVLNKIEEYYNIFIEEYDTYERIYFEINKTILMVRNNKQETIDNHINDMIEIIENYPDEHMKNNAYVALISAIIRAELPLKALNIIDKIELNNYIEIIENLAVQLSEIEQCSQALKLSTQINDPIIQARTLAIIHKNFETICQRGLTFTEKNFLQ